MLSLSRLAAAVLALVSAMAAAQDAAPVAVAQPEVQPAVERIELTRSFTARRPAQLSPRLSGLVESIDVDPSTQIAFKATAACLEDGLVVRALPGDTVAICPPLIIDEAGIDELVDKLTAGLDRTQAAL